MAHSLNTEQSEMRRISRHSPEVLTIGSKPGSASRRYKPPPGVSTRRSTPITTDDIKMFLEHRGRPRGHTLSDLTKTSYLYKLTTRGSRSREQRGSRKGSICSTVGSHTSDNSEKESRKIYLMQRWRIIFRVTIWCRRHVIHHNLRHKLYDEISPYLSKLHFHDYDVPLDLMFDPSQFKADRQLRISEETKQVLTKSPAQRTEKELHKAQVALRNLKSFAEYPMRMQTKIVRVGKYERYDAKRVILRQGHEAEAFYFILSGSVVVMVTDKETKVAKPVAYLYKGMTFGELAIAHRTKRQSTVIAKEIIELLSIDVEDDALGTPHVLTILFLQSFQMIFMSGGHKSLFDPDHNDFIRSLDYLKGWPLEKMDTDPDKCFFHYFKRGEVLAQDTRYSDWLIIVKSGSLNVLKKLKRVKPSLRHVKDVDTEKNCQQTEKEKKTHRETLTMQRRAILSDIKIPLHPLKEVGIVYKGETFHPPEGLKAKINNTNNAVIKKQKLVVNGTEQSQTTNFKKLNTKKKVQNLTLTPEDKIDEDTFSEMMTPTTPLTPILKRRNDRNTIGEKKSLQRLKSKQEQEKEEEDREMEGRQQHIRTLSKDLDNSLKHKMDDELTPADRDPQFVIIQNLTKGQVFGLTDAVLGEQPSLCVVSTGAECIMLHKKYFLSHAPEKLINKLKQELSPYPSTEVMQEGLQTHVNWNMYTKRVNTEMRKYIQIRKDLEHVH